MQLILFLKSSVIQHKFNFHRPMLLLSWGSSCSRQLLWPQVPSRLLWMQKVFSSQHWLWFSRPEVTLRGSGFQQTPTIQVCKQEPTTQALSHAQCQVIYCRFRLLFLPSSRLNPTAPSTRLIPGQPEHCKPIFYTHTSSFPAHQCQASPFGPSLRLVLMNSGSWHSRTRKVSTDPTSRVSL